MSASDLPKLSGPTSLPEGDIKPTSMVILCHGYGSNGDDLIGLVPGWRPILPDTVFISPNAPEKTPMAPGGHQWFALSSLSREEREAGTYKAAPVLDAFIDEKLEEYGLGEDRLVLIGFSQGTMMSLHVGLRREKQLAGILGYSGMLSAPQKLVEELKSKPDVMLMHGDQDNMIPFIAMFEAVGALEAAGVKVDKHISPGCGHGIAPDAIQKGGTFLAKAFG